MPVLRRAIPRCRDGPPGPAVAITAFSLGALLVWSFGATEATETSRALTSAVIGVILGCVVIAAPAVASPPEQPSELPSHPEVSTRV